MSEIHEARRTIADLFSEWHEGRGEQLFSDQLDRLLSPPYRAALLVLMGGQVHAGTTGVAWVVPVADETEWFFSSLL